MTQKMRLDDMAHCFELLSKRQPDPQTELAFSDPFTLLVAVVLSAQATDVGVNKATKGLFAAASTPDQMVALGVEGISYHIRTIGLFNTSRLYGCCTADARPGASDQYCFTHIAKMRHPVKKKGPTCVGPFQTF